MCPFFTGKLGGFSLLPFLSSSVISTPLTLSTADVGVDQTLRILEDVPFNFRLKSFNLNFK